MNGVATITAHDGGRADAALVQRFRQSQTTRERTAVLADLVHQHRRAVLCSCAERLWPDADAAVAAAAGVFAAAGLAMADSAKLPRPDRLRDWLLGIAAQARPVPGQPARIDDVNWEAVRARIALGTPEMRDSPARVASLRQWLERIVATLPEPRQRMYDLFVTRGLDSRNAAWNSRRPLPRFGACVARTGRPSCAPSRSPPSPPRKPPWTHPASGRPGARNYERSWPMLAATMAIRMTTVGATRRCCPLPSG